MKRALLTALALAALSCSSISLQERGLPKRVDVTKNAGSARRVLVADALSDGRIELAALQARNVRLVRRVAYATVDVRREYGSPLMELVEVPLGVVSLPVNLIFSLTGVYDVPESPDRKPKLWRNRAVMIFGPMNPGQSVITGDFVRDPNVDDDVFFSEPVAVDYDMAVPEEGLDIGYSVLDAEGRPLASGRGKTDEFGRVMVPAPPSEGALVELRVGGRAVRLPLRRTMSAGDAAPSSEPTPPPAAAPAAPPAPPPAPAAPAPEPPPAPETPSPPGQPKDALPTLGPGANDWARERHAACGTGALDDCVKLAVAQRDAKADVEKDEVASAGTFAFACARGSRPACVGSALARVHGRGVDKDGAAAAKQLDELCRAGEIGACGYLGHLEMKGEGVKKNPERGMKRLIEACRKGHAPSCRLAEELKKK